jgi:hypothetical protein
MAGSGWVAAARAASSLRFFLARDFSSCSGDKCILFECIEANLRDSRFDEKYVTGFRMTGLRILPAFWMKK